MYLIDLSLYKVGLMIAVFFLQIVVQRGSSRGIHFRGAGPREKVFTISLHYTAVIVLK